MISWPGHPVYDAYYGSSRQRNNVALRDLLCRSAVLRPEDRQKGENEWHSTNKQYFKKHENIPKASQWNANLQNSSDITFGDTSGELRSTIQSDFLAKTGKRRQSLPPPVLCSLPDMSSKYVGEFKIGDSIYQNHFDGAKTFRDWLEKEKGLESPTSRKRSKSTDYQRTTHFILGNDPTHSLTETKVSFSLPPLSNPVTAMGLTRFPHVPSGQRQKSTKGRAATARLPPNPNSEFNPSDYSLPLNETGGPAGVSTITPKGYSHVLPKLMQIKSSTDSPGAIGALRSYLLSENYQQFQNPRDPTSVNVLSAFSKYDTDRSGYITRESLKQICEDICIPITDTEIDLLLKECNTLGDDRIDYVEFAKYLLAEHVPLDIEGTYESTTQQSFNPIPSEIQNQFTSRPRSGKPTLANQTSVVKISDLKTTDDSDKDWSDKFGTIFQTGTHFEFGNFKEHPKSVYQQDINCEEGSSRPSCSIALALPDSKIFPVPSIKSLRPETTNKSEFTAPPAVNHSPNMHDTSTNKGRDRMDSVVLSDGLQQVKLTETQLNFKSPEHSDPSSSLAPPPTSVQLLSQQPAMERPHDYAIRETEAQRTFRSPQCLDSELTKRQRAETARTASRLKDNRQTHFEFGSSGAQSASEMTSQFLGRAPDTMTASAGTSNLPTSHFSHVFPRDKKTTSSTDDSLALENKLKRAASAKHVNPRDPINLNLRKAFLEFDKDLTGRISSEDIVNICYQQRINITDQDLKELMERCDHDQDGQIDYHDFSRFLTSLHSAFTRQENKSESTTKRDFRPMEERDISDEREKMDAAVKKRYTPSAASHYFHMDPEKKPSISATQQHFQHPLSRVFINDSSYRV